MLSKRIVFAAVFMFMLFSRSYAQVSLQNGGAVFSLPIFNWQDDKSRLTTVIAVSYNSGSGLKVNDVASNIGQGWNLTAGGVVSRMQVGEPDDQPAYFNPNKGTEQDNDLTKYSAGYLYHSIDAANGCPNSLTRYPIYGSKNQLYDPHNLEQEDKQLDHFAFQFNGKSGMFILDTTGGDHGVLIGDSKVKVTFTRDPSMISQGIRTTITSFSIQDVDGLIYKFAQHELTRVLCQEFCDKNLAVPIAQPTFNSGGVYYQAGFQVGYNNKQVINPYVIGSWYLSEIDDPLTLRKTIFTYGYTRNISNVAGADVSWNQWHNYVLISNKNSMTSTPALSSISYPDGHAVIFNYSSTPRFDLSGDVPLASIDVQYNGRYISEYQFNTTYFVLNRYGTPTTPYQKSVARLCLKSIKKIGVDLKEDTPPYIFDYYTGSNNPDDFVPPPFFYAKDPWGFFNGNNSVLMDNSAVIPLNLTSVNLLNFTQLQSLCFINNTTANAYTDPVSHFGVYGVYLNPKPGYAQNGLLKQIVYPTGGNLSYQYAQNTGTLIGGSTAIALGGVHVSQISSSDGGYSNGCANPVITQYNYVMNGTGSASSLWGMEAPLNMQVSGSHYAPEQKGFHCTWTSGCGCYWHYMYPGILSMSEAISLTTMQNIMNTLAPFLTVLSTIMDVLDIVNVCLDATPGAIVAVLLDAITLVVTIAISCFHNYSKDGATPVYHNSNLNDVSPLPAQFKRVEIIENPGTIGKTVQDFTSSDDYPLWLPGANTAFSPKQRFAPWAYGLPKLTTIYDAAGNTIKQTKNVYDFTKAWYPLERGSNCGSDFPTGPCTVISSCKCMVQYSYSQRNSDWTQASTYSYNTTNYTTSSNGNMLVDIYPTYGGRVELDTTYERTFRVGDASQYVQSYSAYTYNQYNYQIASITTQQSNAVTNVRTVYYSGDYSGGIFNTMFNNNIIDLPVAKESYVGTYPAVQKMANEEVTEYAQVANGDIRASRTLEQRFAVPVSSWLRYPGPPSVNYAGYKITQAFTYDANSNLVGLRDEANRTVANIFDYNDKYIVATVTNADPLLDKAAYTSFETTGFGGWGLTGAGPAYSTTSFITGARGFVLTSNTLYASINSAKPYILSFWATNSSVVVTGGASLVKSAPTYNGMTYYEYNIALGTGGVSLTGNSIIDELRLYPSNARMRTTTYDPLLGKTSESDENNRILYYTYDNLGRLQLIKDENMNIVKMYEYNNVSATKQAGCPTTYYSRMLSETVSRTNCSAGYQGGPVTFTLPANKYTSTVNQFDADIQAEIDLLTNAQNYANSNGSCSLIYYNTPQSESDSTQNCIEGDIGGWVTYTVPAGRYSSIISQADANNQALAEVAASAAAYANDPAHAVCIVNPAPDWTWLEGAPTYCSSVGGALPPHQFVMETDLNPNSSTYNQTRWSDAGPQDFCPANTYYNASQSQVFTRNNCSGGSAVTYTVAPGIYNSTVSQAAADQQATADIAANGQNYANAHGTCCAPTFNFSSGISVTYMNIALAGTTVNFTFVFTYPSIGNPFVLGNVSPSCCWPTATRMVPYLQGSMFFYLYFYSNGQVQVQLMTGTAPTGQVIGMTGSFDLQSNTYYSAAASGTYAKNNCTAGQVGSSVTYSVAQYRYTSIVSQAAADQLAQNDVSANGQNYANANGSCSNVCTFNWSAAIPNHLSSSISSSSTTTSFSFTFVAPTNGYTNGTIGTIPAGGCLPTGTRTVNVADGTAPTRHWNVTITSTGSVSLSMTSGTAPTNTYPPVVVSGTFTK